MMQMRKDKAGVAGVGDVERRGQRRALGKMQLGDDGLWKEEGGALFGAWGTVSTPSRLSPRRESWLVNS